MKSLYWLPKPINFAESLKKLKDLKTDPPAELQAIRALSQHDLDFIQINNLYRRLKDCRARVLHPDEMGLRSLRLAFLSSSTIDHLLPALHVACLRRGVLLDCYTGPYNQYRQELLNPSSGLHVFKPEVVYFALDAEMLSSLPLTSTSEDARSRVTDCVTDWMQWADVARQTFGAVVVYQTLVIPPHRYLGQFDSAVSATPSSLAQMLNQALRQQATKARILLCDVDELAGRIGKSEWFNYPLWHHAKQAIAPDLGPIYGDLLARILAALRGLSAKCLVLDLDNTLWGGVIGDDGLSGIEIGQGTGRGEAFLAFQMYVKHLCDRGIILAVVSKNDEAIALSPFLQHNEMHLKQGDFAVFIANWDNKAGNIEEVASRLSIGLDAIVFFDDNPAERSLVRQLLPQVTVLEVPEDPAWYASCLSDSGSFEAVSFTMDDVQRVAQYQDNQKRIEAKTQAHDLEGYLKGLDMRMEVAPFDETGLSRIAQLINKSNQFNLTTRRYTEEQVRQMMGDKSVLTFQVRLKDACGDNGMISVLIGRPKTDKLGSGLYVDTWLMSCRVLGRQVEEEILNTLVGAARQHGYVFLEGEYLPTEKNNLVKEHYRRLGFHEIPSDGSLGSSRWRLILESFKHRSTHITTTIQERDLAHDIH